MKYSKETEKKAFADLKGKFGYKNQMAAPRLTKIVVAVGTGSGVKRDKNRNDLVMNRLSNITGQKPSLRAAKKSVASFKIRQGDPVGVMVTLRGAKMYAFFDKLINIALPRTKDFRGIDNKIVDSIGNLTMAIKESTIFPETGDEELKDVFSMAVTVVTTAKTRDEALAFFEMMGIPFKK